MATDAELRLILRANDQASASLDKVQGKLTGVGKTAADIGKKFAGGQFFGSILSGVGLGSGMQLMERAVSMITASFREAAEAAKMIEDQSAKSLTHTEKMLAIRREMLSITKQEDLGVLEFRAREARSAFEDANRQKFSRDRKGNAVARVDTPEEQAEIGRRRAAAEGADLALEQKKLANFRLASIEVERFFKSVEEGAAKIGEATDTKLRDFFYTIDNPTDLAATNAALKEFFDSVEAGAEMVEDKLNTALRDFFYTIDNAPEAKQSNLQRARGFANEARGGDSVAGGVELGLQSTVAGLGTTAQQVAGTIQNTLGSAVYAISDGIAGWASGMMSFGDAASQIWTNFKMAALQAFTDMVAQYAVKKAAMFAIDVLFSAKGLALQLASAAKSLIAWIPSAIAASISSFGTAALVGAAAVAAVIAATGGFADGGMVNGPGSGTSDSILARVSNGEYIVPAVAVQRIGERNLDAMSYGAASGASGGSLGGGGGFGRGATILVDNRREADRFRRGSPMETQIVQVMQANRYRVAHT